MAPHTISPTPDSQGLGISFSTLSPPPVQNGPVYPGFTGMGVGPRQPQSLGRPMIPQFQASSHRPLPQPLGPASGSPPRELPATSTHGRPLYQPSFALRPTHTRTNSHKGFTSFSAIPPSPARHDPPVSTTPVESPTTVRGFIPRDDVSETSTECTVLLSKRDAEQGRDRVVRKASTASASTSISKHSRRSKSVELLRRISSRGGEETVSGGKYVPLLAVEDHQQPSSTLAQASPSSPLHIKPRLQPRSSKASSSTGTRSGPSRGLTDLSEGSSSFNPSKFPLPPRELPRADTAQSDPYGQRPYPPGLSRGMSRSTSFPNHMGSVPESQQMDKRISDPSTGIHSKNRVLLNAESGGMMLAFSPSGDGVWREGEIICGSGTGLIPSPSAVPTERMADSRSSREDELKARPWSDSTMAQHMRKNTTGRHGRSLSDGEAILARQGTLFHPGSSKQRASAELCLMLGGTRSRRLSGNKLLPPPELEAWTEVGGGMSEVKLEAAKKRKARVEVDVVLERECVVEGGEIRGRMEVRINGGKKGEGLRVGGGKVRVIGFEDISSSSRHIFYHHPHALPLFAHPTPANGPCSSLFASDPDEEGYRLAAEGTHFIPFRMRLPLGGGAKGSYSAPNQKGPCVRYVVVGSIKLFTPSTGKRSIAHFYRSIVVLPYFNPTVALAPSNEPIEVKVERGLGWSLGGEKGKVDVRVSLGRRIWVAGQRVWCEVGIRNESTKKINKISLALLQTVQTFHPDSGLDTRDITARLRMRSQSARNFDDPGTPDADACQTSTNRRRVNEEVMEADFPSRGQGRVTGKGWWTGLEPGERDHWDMSLLIPSGLLTIRRTRLIEVTYMLRVTVNGSIYVDVPITLINFLSIDPPPMPGDGYKMVNQVRQDIHEATELKVHLGQGAYSGHPAPSRMPSDMSLGSAANPARASSTTLHIDSLLQVERARAAAEIESRGIEGVGRQSSRPMSVGSAYTLTQSKSVIDIAAIAGDDTTATGAKRPALERFTSYLSDRSDAEPLSEDDEEGESQSQDRLGEMTQDLNKVQSRQKMGRQTSLALAISRAEARALEAMRELEREIEEERRSASGSVSSPGVDSMRSRGVFKPEGTPSETTIELGLTPNAAGGSQVDTHLQQEEEVAEVEEREQAEEALQALGEVVTVDDDGPGGLEALEDDERTEYAGDDTVIEDLIPPEDEASEDTGGDGADLAQSQREQPDEEVAPLKRSKSIPRIVNGYNYGSDSDDEEEQRPHDFDPESTDDPNASMRARLANVDPYASISPDQHIHQTQTRSINGSFAVSELESEVGQVHEAVKRNLSVRLPPRLLPLDGARTKQKSDPSVSPTDGSGKCDRSGSTAYSQSSGETDAGRSASPSGSTFSRNESPSATGSEYRRESSNSNWSAHPRKSSSPMAHVQMPGGRRDSSTVITPSPLRNVGELPDEAPVLSPSPSKKSNLVISSKHQRPLSPGLSPRSTPPHKLSVDIVPISMARQASGNSQLRHQISMKSRYDTTVEGEVADDDQGEIDHGYEEGAEAEAPGLAPSVASDSASSEGHLESPPATSVPHMPDLKTPTESASSPRQREYFADQLKNQQWAPGEHLLQPEVYLQHEREVVAPYDVTIDTKGLSAESDFSHEDNYHPRMLHDQASSSDHSHSHESHDGHRYRVAPGSPGSLTSGESILPSVKTKIAQLNSRDEALRRFSVSAAAASQPTHRPSMTLTPTQAEPRGSLSQFSARSSLTPSHANAEQANTSQRSSISHLGIAPKQSLTPSIRSDLYRDASIASQYSQRSSYAPSRAGDAISTSVGGSPTGPTKRRSYTTALGPRPPRTMSDDTEMNLTSSLRNRSGSEVLELGESNRTFSDDALNQSQSASPARPAEQSNHQASPSRIGKGLIYSSPEAVGSATTSPRNLDYNYEYYSPFDLHEGFSPQDRTPTNRIGHVEGGRDGENPVHSGPGGGRSPPSSMQGRHQRYAATATATSSSITGPRSGSERLERQTSASSTSTSATALEFALSRRPGGLVGGPRSPRNPAGMGVGGGAERFR